MYLAFIRRSKKRRRMLDMPGKVHSQRQSNRCERRMLETGERKCLQSNADGSDGMRWWYLRGSP
jgi:hypothetical protein